MDKTQFKYLSARTEFHPFGLDYDSLSLTFASRIELNENHCIILPFDWLESVEIIEFKPRTSLTCTKPDTVFIT